eukprot:scaffold46730_cov26-Prasinocladus_malaysianus.AAC.1
MTVAVMMTGLVTKLRMSYTDGSVIHYLVVHQENKCSRCMTCRRTQRSAARRGRRLCWRRVTRR